LGKGPLRIMADSASWRLAPSIAPKAQGLVVSPFAHEPFAETLFLTLPPNCGGGWLADFRAAAPITDATGEQSSCAAVAFTATGLARMGLDGAAMEGFSESFLQGMAEPNRARRLGDTGAALLAEQLRWGSGGDDEARPAVEVHALWLVYAVRHEALADRIAALETACAKHGIIIGYRKRLSLRFDENGIAREHFGFADGLSQPIPFNRQGDDAIAQAAPKDPWHGVAAGDILFGHLNAHNEPSPGPEVADDPRAGGLDPGGASFGFRDLGLNGSYLVVRELHQDVVGFWKGMDAAAAATGHAAEDIAAKAIGRTRDGVPLGANADAASDAGPANAFGFFDKDRYGDGCPMGAHIRRGNPRDGLAPEAGMREGLLAAVNNHRILRRGRKFGPDMADPRVDDGEERGLMFMCLNTDLVRQFEFVQQTWINNPNFATLKGETDPIIGVAGPFTLPGEPVRTRVQVPTVVKLAGGAYFFLPSLPALDYLGKL
jgi:deferrochelatase/peroxidase EfeB